MKQPLFSEFKTLVPYLKPYYGRYALGLFFLLLVDAAQIVVPQCVKQALDLITLHSSAPETWTPAPVYRLALTVLALAVVISVGRFFWRYFIHGSSRRIEAKLRADIFDHLISLNYDFYQQNKIGDLMARSTNDLNAVRDSIGWGMVALIDGTVMAVAILVVMFVQSPGTAIMSIIPLPLIAVGVALFGRIVGRVFTRVQGAYSAMSDHIQETFAGIRVVKSFVKEWWFLRKFADTNEDYQRANMELVKVFGTFFPFIGLLSGTSTLIMLWVGGGKVLAGTMTAGELAAFISYLHMLIWPIMSMGFTVNSLQRGAASMKRINEIFTTEPTIVSPVDGKSPDTSVDPAIKITGLTFAYPVVKAERNAQTEGADKASPEATATVTPLPTLADITLDIPRGTVFGVFGKTGSGKSTLLKCLTRLVDVPPGMVSVGGVDVCAADLGKLRTSFGVVPQDTYLFSESIKENIAYGIDGKPDDTALERAADIAALYKDLAAFSDGWDTVVGERGLTLSGGQKQRTAIARALAVNPPGGPDILILDDAMSAVDIDTEERILASLLEARKGKTTVIVSHRVSTMSHADTIAVLDEGRLAELGSPRELLAKEGGLFQGAAKLQGELRQ
jgi:ATP-binding cassette subfamily B protein